ncbi:MAG TPA: hypothetical protein VFT45_12070 [Longimicrobium sp.]|nr:hypothetical protein [Longimicrobium sp.]
MIDFERWSRRAFLGLAVASAAACTQGRPVVLHGVDPCTAPGADTTGWKVADAGPFQFSVPPGFQRRSGNGVDSYVGRWEGPGGRFVYFDWGLYSGSLGDYPARLRDAAECTVEIGGHPAQVARGMDAEGWRGSGPVHVAAAAWANVRPPNHLALIAASPAASDAPVLVSIVRSVRFKPGEPRL